MSQSWLHPGITPLNSDDAGGTARQQNRPLGFGPERAFGSALLMPSGLRHATASSPAPFPADLFRDAAAGLYAVAFFANSACLGVIATVRRGQAAMGTLGSVLRKRQSGFRIRP